MNMTTKDDGGPAFMPAFPTYSPNPGAQGMTLRDWFAGQALAGLAGIIYESGEFVWGFDQTASIAYAHADAMLDVRKGGAE